MANVTITPDALTALHELANSSFGKTGVSASASLTASAQPTFEAFEAK